MATIAEMVTRVKALKRALHFCVPALTLLAAPLASAQDAANTVEVQFGYLYGGDIDRYSTTVVGGTGPLGEAMAGHTFYWVCLDITSTAPDPIPFAGSYNYSYSVSTDTSILSAGEIWGSGIEDPTSRASIGDAITNMFFEFKSELFYPSNPAEAEHGMAFQMAAWHLTNGYVAGIWSGVVDETAIEALISHYSDSISDDPLIEAFLLASLIDSGGNQQVFFGNPSPASQPVDGEDQLLQTVAFFTEGPAVAIPEPGSVLLLGAAGGLALLRRFRSR